MEVAIDRLLLLFSIAATVSETSTGGSTSRQQQSVHLDKANSYIRTYHRKHVPEAPTIFNGNNHQSYYRPTLTLDYKNCCSENNGSNHTTSKEMSKVLKHCIKKVNHESKDWYKFENVSLNDRFSCHSWKKSKNRYYCIADCVMRGIGALGDDGIMNAEKAKAYILRDTAADWLKAVEGKAVDRCATLNGDHLLSKGEYYKCNPKAAIFKHCIKKVVITTCPEEYFKKTEYCRSVKRIFEETDI